MLVCLPFYNLYVEEALIIRIRWIGLSVYDTYQAFVVHRHDEGGIAAWIARNRE